LWPINLTSQTLSVPGKKSYQYTVYTAAVQPAGIPADLQDAVNQLETASEEELENFARSLKAGKDAKRYVHMSDLVSIEEQEKGDGFLQWVQLVMAGEQHLLHRVCCKSGSAI
jgi:hypothetical protein